MFTFKCVHRNKVSNDMQVLEGLTLRDYEALVFAVLLEYIRMPFILYVHREEIVIIRDDHNGATLGIQVYLVRSAISI